MNGIKFYAVSCMTSKKESDIISIDHFPMFVSANSKEEAVGIGHKQLMEEYKADPSRSYSVSAVEVPAEVVTC
jgi:hypothetical protein